MMAVLMKVLERSGAKTIDEVWPNLEVFFHGGVAFTPYREQYHRLIPSARHALHGNLQCLGGFLRSPDRSGRSRHDAHARLRCVYEFIPLEEVGTAHPTVLPLWEVEAGRHYALVISTSCGLWRYQIGDTVRFTQTFPHKFVISGRTKSFINAFGEELMVDNAEQGLKAACQATGAEVREYTAAPVFMDAAGKCRHQWLIESRKRRPTSTFRPLARRSPARHQLGLRCQAL